MTLYNCSVGREDCSLCKNADRKYECVWCSKQKACVYETLCSTQGSDTPDNVECPAPEITGVSIYIVLCSEFLWLTVLRHWLVIGLCVSGMDSSSLCLMHKGECWLGRQLKIQIPDGINSSFTRLSVLDCNWQTQCAIVLGVSMTQVVTVLTSAKQAKLKRHLQPRTVTSF